MADKTLDCKNLRCPMPIVMLSREITVFSNRSNSPSKPLMELGESNWKPDEQYDKEADPASIFRNR